MALVFSAFKERPGVFPKVLMDLIVSSNELLSASSVISGSSADCEIWYSVSPMKIPFYRMHDLHCL